MDPILRRSFVDGLLTPDGGECYPCLELTAVLSPLMTHGASLVSLFVLAYSVVQFSGYIIDDTPSFLSRQTSSVKTSPPGFPQPVVPRPSHRETPETSPSPILSRMSRRRSAALRLAAAGDAAIAAGAGWPLAACGRGAWAKKGVCSAYPSISVTPARAAHSGAEVQRAAAAQRSVAPAAADRPVWAECRVGIVGADAPQP